MQDVELNIRQGSYLPHWTKDGAVYHVIFRLADSLPQKTLLALDAERKELIGKIENEGRKPTVAEMKRMDELFSENIERFLDSGYGKCWLARDDVAKIAADTLMFFNNKRYELYAWCIMPNHVHVILKPNANYLLQDIICSWKSFIATRSNKLIGRTGAFWHREYFDRIIRKYEHVETIIDYVWKNPDEAGFKNWSWRWKIA